MLFLMSKTTKKTLSYRMFPNDGNDRVFAGLHAALQGNGTSEEESEARASARFHLAGLMKALGMKELPR